MTDIVERLRDTLYFEPDSDLPEEAANEIEKLRDQLRAASEWRDISTAPRDGTFILAYQPDRVMDTVAWDVSREGWMNGYDDKKNYPTHWKPLPAPPQRDEVTK